MKVAKSVVPTATPSPLPTPLGLSDPDAAQAVLKCQKGLTRLANRLLADRVGILSKCAAELYACIQTKGDDAKQLGCLGRAGAKCSNSMAKSTVARQKKVQKIALACQAPSLAFDTGILAHAGLGFEDLRDACNAPADIAFLAECIAKKVDCLAEEIVADQQPRAADLLFSPNAGIAPEVLTQLVCIGAGEEEAEAGVADKKGIGRKLVQCERTIRRASLKLVRTRLGGINKCAQGFLACLQVSPEDTACLAKAEDVCVAEFEKIRKASDLARAAHRKCGEHSLPFESLRDSRGANVQALDETCEGAGVASLKEFPDYADCLTRRHSCAVDRIISLEMPRIPALLALLPKSVEIPFESDCMSIGLLP